MKTKAEYSKDAKDKLQWQLNYRGQHPLMMFLLIYIITTDETIGNFFLLKTDHDWIITISMLMSIIWAIISFTWKFPAEKISFYASYLESEDLRKMKLKNQKLRQEQFVLEQKIKKQETSIEE